MTKTQFTPKQCKSGKIKTRQPATITGSGEVREVWKLPSPKTARRIANGHLTIPAETCPTCC